MNSFRFSGAKSRIDPLLFGRGSMQTIKHFEAFHDQGFDVVSIGARPTGRMHVGNLLVLAAGVQYLSKNPSARLVFDVMDLDFDNQRGSQFTPFTSQSHTAEFRAEAGMAIKSLCCEFGVDPNRVSINLLSERLDAPLTVDLGHDSLRDLFLTLFTSTEAIKALKYAALNQMTGLPFKPPISLICPNCRQSSADFAQLDTRTNSFSSRCRNDSCSVGEYETRLDAAEPFNIYYTIDPVRDLTHGSSVVHIFGGDYDLPHGRFRLPKYAMVAGGMEVARMVWGLERELPAFFIAPLITGHDGAKVSKSTTPRTDGHVPFEEHLMKELRLTLDLFELAVRGSGLGVRQLALQSGHICT